MHIAAVAGPHSGVQDKSEIDDIGSVPSVMGIVSEVW